MREWATELTIYMVALIGGIVLVCITGCTPAPQRLDGIACVGLALACIESTPDVVPVTPTKCCAECKGTGRVKTGDGLSTAPCECPDSCPCKAPKSAAAGCAECKSVLKGFAPLPSNVGAK